MIIMTHPPKRKITKLVSNEENNIGTSLVTLGGGEHKYFSTFFNSGSSYYIYFVQIIKKIFSTL